MWASNIGIQFRSLKKVENSAASPTWVGCGSGPALFWRNTKVSNLWRCIRFIQVSVIAGDAGLSGSLILAADFVDGKHNVTLGGSWATHPRIAGRKSLSVIFTTNTDRTQLT